MKFNILLVGILSFALSITSEADQTSIGSLSKSALDDYVVIFRREANLLTTNVNIDTRRSFLRNVENSIKLINETQGEFEEKIRLYSTQGGKGGLVTRLRYALAARSALKRCFYAVQLSSEPLSSIQGYTRTHAAPELGEQRSQIVEFMVTLKQHLDATIEALLREIEHKLKTTNP